MREYTRVQTVVANLPYVGMVLTGTGILFYSFEPSTWSLIAAACYFLYGIAGAFWIMLDKTFTWWVLVLLILFTVISWVLPLLSKRHSCGECTQKETCHWMGEAALFHSMNKNRDSEIAL
jgi:hypothetical protein